MPDERKWTDEDIIRSVMTFGMGCSHGKEQWLSSLGIPTEKIRAAKGQHSAQVYRISFVLEVDLGKDRQTIETEVLRHFAYILPKWSGPNPYNRAPQSVGYSDSSLTGHRGIPGVRWTLVRVEAVDDES